MVDDAAIGPGVREIRPFNSSEKIDLLATALAQAQAEMPTIQKSKTARVETRTGSGYSYDYADLSAILKVTRPVLAKHGIAVLQAPSVEARGSVTIKTLVLHTSGQWLCESLSTPVTDAGDPQKLGSAISYGRRYAYCGMTGVQPEDEDDDGQKARERAEQKPRKAPSRRVEPAGPEPSGPRSEDEPSSEAAATITTVNADGSAGGQKGRLLGILKEHRIDLKEFGGYLKEVYGVNAWSEIKVADYDQIVGLAQNWPHKGSAAPTN